MKKDKEDSPLWLKINFDHNHSLTRADFLKYRSVSDATKREYTKLFESGVSPSGAHLEVKKRLKAEYVDDWPVMFSDRSVLPSVFWVYYWHRRWMDNKMGSRDGIDTFVKARELIDNYNVLCKEEQSCDGRIISRCKSILCNTLCQFYGLIYC